MLCIFHELKIKKNILKVSFPIGRPLISFATSKPSLNDNVKIDNVGLMTKST